jgi:hypothetical protein
MTSTRTLLRAGSGSAPQIHASEAEYKSWVYKHIPHPTLRWQRMLIYRRFVESFPNLSTWFQSPLDLRLGFCGGPVYANGRTTAHEAIGYLAYLSLVNGISLDYEYLLARQFTRLLSAKAADTVLASTTTRSRRGWLVWCSWVTPSRASVLISLGD